VHVAPVQRPDQSVQRIEQRLGHVRRQGIADRVLGSVAGSGAHRHAAQPGHGFVAKLIGQLRQDPRPAVGAAIQRIGQGDLGASRGDERGLVDRGVLVARRGAAGPRPARG